MPDNMPENLRKIIEQILFMSDEQILPSKLDEFIKQKNWYKKLHWTQKKQERFIEWLSEFLKKNWEGVVKYKPTTKKLRDMAAQEIVMNYGCVVRPIKMSDFTMVISFEQLKDVLSDEEYKKFMSWMFGQTVSVYGVYARDLERFIRYKFNPENEPIHEWD